MLEKVILSSDTYYAYLQQALTTEHEECVALLLGSSTPTTVTILNLLFCMRKDKRKDRVEVDAQQLSLAMSVAEEKKLRVVGWSHSHPHIVLLF